VKRKHVSYSNRTRLWVTRLHVCDQLQKPFILVCNADFYIEASFKNI